MPLSADARGTENAGGAGSAAAGTRGTLRHKRIIRPHPKQRRSGDFMVDSLSSSQEFQTTTRIVEAHTVAVSQ